MKQKFITIVLTIIAVFAPLLIAPTPGYYNIPKCILLLAAGLVLLILLLASYKTLTIDKKDTIILIFLGLVFLSTFFSSNIKTSILGASIRYEGLLMFATYVCIYFCAKKYFKYEKISIFVNIMFAVSMLIGILGIAQYYVKTTQFYPLFGKGICSTFGNSNFFGSFISIVLPISICAFIFKGTKRGFILSLVMFFNMISSGTRSAWVAFAVVGILGLLYLIAQKNRKYFKRAIILFVCFILIFTYLLNGFNFILEKLNCEKIVKINPTTQIKINQIKRDLENAKENGFSNEMGSNRIEIWNMTLKLIGKKPILGCGPDNLWDGLIKNCPEEVCKFVKRTYNAVDKAHNEYLQIGATLGIPALICYLTFIALILFSKIKLTVKNRFYFILCITIISYLVQAFFNISTIGVAPLFWMILGLIDNKNFEDNFNKIYNFL